ncbi:UDP-N-acetylmuramoyl-L-alanyl-D-glutamate--2,6-diaminopimelate ligase [Leptospira langatensis]|uniref:UDP-N-acetylmuramoyl-L-alanyl-D-glutamate--2,6-diaminopimelate ligase n=1 Tax=Leptospira langatensis TaxID=2484983 RepID=A0A5F1ZSE7_9LEPT|nr:UDP-N-acetylmuramoyl-L-alanyl-D-glutamate--2,6-diaminopimelate ligase [Leptospira langatensis]TGJ98873.1 UDP-N-acetylmuramoyl-L-alanyl-D-glutamate--2,6-diaminopimelate ligase [Leptospira langatensis]TGL40560.1 UDP-N-acetylmuramoyl-L-alanyl-D-glutamate--2,6-diaminopimelate ligase [Leptospira langatensis]
MRISEILDLFPEIRLEDPSPYRNEEISFVRTDSRKLGSEDLFCVPLFLGEKGLEYAKSSASRFVLISNTFGISKLENKIVLRSSSDPEALAGPIASRILGDPSSKMKVVGVTGTNGKTSLTHILAFLGESQGKSCGIIGTTGVKFKGKVVDTGYTTPDPSSLQEILKEMLENGVEYVFIETSSHGLKLGRTNGIRFKAGIFSNLTQDHLDFHPSMQDYLESKALLFSSLNSYEDTFGVYDAEAPGGRDFAALLPKVAPKLSLFALGSGKGEIPVHNEHFSLEKTTYEIGLPSSWKGNTETVTNLLGGFNVRNTALAFVTCLALGWEKEKLLSALKNIPQIPGRFQIYYSPDRTRMAVVDYAHTPDALQNILRSIRESKPKELIALFGCGGDRDRTKRPKMGKIAQDLADKVILTSDNPRTEDPESILDDIQEGFTGGYIPFLREADRAAAIRFGISSLQEGACLLVAGKGHEDYQIVGKEKRHFDDGEEIRKAFDSLQK